MRYGIVGAIFYKSDSSLVVKRSMSMSQSSVTFDSQKKHRKYVKVIDDLKTVINTGMPVYKLFGK